MKSRSVFEELSRFMPDTERSSLLEKIKKSLYQEPDLPATGEERAEESPRWDDRHEELLQRDFGRVSLFRQLVIWLRSKLSGKNTREIFVTMRIKLLKKRINAAQNGLTGFETRDLSPRIAEQVFALYSVIVTVRSLYARIWTDPEGFRRMFMTLLEARVPAAKRSLEDLISTEALEELYRETQEKTTLREEVDRRLKGYVSSISERVFAEVEESIMPLALTKDLVLFPFLIFFQRFHFTPLEGEAAEKTYFKSASAMLCLGDLERLAQALHQAARVSSAPLGDDVLMYLSVLQKEMDEDEERQFGATGVAEVQPRESVETDDRLGSTVKQIIAMSHELNRTLPLDLLVKYFRRDPYYELTKKEPHMGLKGLFSSALALRSHAELERRFPEIRERVLEGQIADMFSGRPRVRFQNYREYKTLDYQKLSLPFFRHTRSLALLYDYINGFYVSHFHEAVQILERQVLAQNRITRDRLLQHSGAVVDAVERIRQFDHSLSPEFEDGKLFQRLRFTLMQDSGHQKLFRSLVLQKDREVTSIIDRGVESLRGLQRVLEEVLSAKTDNLRAALNNHYFIDGDPVDLREVLTKRRDHLAHLLRIVDQVIKLERG